MITRANMAEADAVKSLSGLLNGIAQKVYYGNSEITEELLKSELYPELSQDEFTALHHKMKGLLKSIATADMDHAQLEAFLTAQTKKQGGGGVSAEQAAALSRFWKSQRVRVKESLVAQNRWEPSLRGLSWRVDLQAAASRGDAAYSGPVTLVELELGRAGQMCLQGAGGTSVTSAPVMGESSPDSASTTEDDSEFVCLEFDETRVNQVLKKMADIQESIDRIVHST